MKIFEEDNIKINLPVMIDSRMLICANSGGGKSYAIRKMLEEAGNEVMSIILDVEGEFKTLREKFDFLLIGQTEQKANGGQNMKFEIKSRWDGSILFSIEAESWKLAVGQGISL